MKPLLSEGGRSQNSLGPWSHAGDRLAYGSTRRNGADRDLYVVDPKDPKSDRKLAEVQGGGWRISDWLPDAKQLRLLTPKGGPEKIAYSRGYFRGTARASTSHATRTPRSSA